MSSFDSDPNNFDNTNNNSSYESQNRRREFTGQPGGGYDQQASRFDNSNSMGGGGFDQQTPGRDQFSTSGYNDDSFGPQSQSQTGRSEFKNERSYGGDSYGAGNGTESNRSTGYGTGNTGSAYGTGNDFSGDRNDDSSYGSGNNNSNNKPSFGDKMKGTAEVAAGKMTKNPGMVERGQDRKTEGSNY
ncbi:hypothetical protein F5879DRAFT_1003190 [Lentinula edodes]|nr:hypothetical protein F5879DRAFT_1003190 [Lentinula edodes]